MNMEILLRRQEGVYWDLGCFPEKLTLMSWLSSSATCGSNGWLGPKQHLGQVPAQAVPKEVPGELCGGDEGLPVPVKGTRFSSSGCGTGMHHAVCGNGHISFGTRRPRQKHSPESRCLPDANEVVFQFLGVEHSFPC